MESYISGYRGLEETPSVELSSQELRHSPVGASWEADDYTNQVVYDKDGKAVNLSSAGWSFLTYSYDYDISGNNIINNNTSDSELVPAERAVALAVLMFMFSVGFVANALLVYTVVRYRAMRRGPNLYFLNISAADLVYLLVCLPTVSVSYVLVDWRFGNSVCQLENYATSVCLSVNALTILAAGLHQCLTITYPNKSHLFRSTKARMWMLGFFWILSCALMAPRTLIFGQISAYHRSGRVTLCGRKSDVTARQIDSALMFIVFYLLPLLMFAVCCCMQGRALWQSRHAGFGPTSPLKTTHVRCRRRNTKIIFAITAIFAIGWLPLHVYQLVEDFDYGNILLGEYIDRGTVALFVSFAAKMCNPISFWLFNRRFTGPAKGTFKCKNSKTGAADHTSCMASTSLGNHTSCMASTSLGNHTSCMASTSLGNHTSCMASTSLGNHTSCMASTSLGNHTSCMASTSLGNHTSCMASTSLGRADTMWPESVLLSRPVTPLFDMLPPRHDRMTSNRELTLAKSPSFPHLQPLLKKQPRFCDCKCRSGLSSRPDSWPCAKEGPLVETVTCSCTSLVENDGD